MEKTPHPKIAKRLQFRLGIFLLIGLVILGIVVRDIVIGELSWWLGFSAALVGLGVGYVLGRVIQVRWHAEEEKVIMQMDVFGFIAIGVYILLRLGSTWVLGQWLTGTALSTFTLAVLGGALIGRFLGLRTSIVRLLDQPRQ